MASPIRIENLDRTWGQFRLRDLSLEVSAGDYFVLLGPIGSGKTLLLETIAGLHHLSAGRIRLGDRDVSNLRPECRGIGFVYQRSMLFPHLSVLENIRFGLRFLQVRESDRRKRVDRLVGLLGLAELLERRTTNLSGGERQKIALARALAVEPEVLLLDEPLSPLDDLSKDTLRDQLKQIHRELGTTTIEVTHDQVSARIMADRVGVLQGGRLLQVGEMAEVFERPQSQFVAEFVGAQNVFSGVARRDGELTWIKIGTGIELQAQGELEGPVGLCIRPEAIQLHSQPQEQGPNTLKGALTDISDRGAMIRLTLRSEALDFRALVPRPRFAELACNVGQELWFSLPPEAVHVFVEDPYERASH